MLSNYLILLIVLFVIYKLNQVTYQSHQLRGGGSITSSQPATIPAPAKPRMSFQYPYTSPWEFYQSPWLMYRQPQMLSREAYYRYSVPNYYTKFNQDYYGSLDHVAC